MICFVYCIPLTHLCVFPEWKPSLAGWRWTWRRTPITPRGRPSKSQTLNCCWGGLWSVGRTSADVETYRRAGVHGSLYCTCRLNRGSPALASTLCAVEPAVPPVLGVNHCLYSAWVFGWGLGLGVELYFRVQHTTCFQKIHNGTPRHHADLSQADCIQLYTYILYVSYVYYCTCVCVYIYMYILIL